MQSSRAAIPNGPSVGMERPTNDRARLLAQVECEARDAYSLGPCENISTTGILVRTRETFEVSKVLLVRFVLPLPTALPIEVKETVVRVRPSEFMAIQFVDLQERYCPALAEFVEQGSKEAKPLSSGG